MNRATLFLLLIVLTVGFVGSIPLNVLSQDFVREISSDTIWSSQSLRSPVVVSQGATLTILSGATVNLNGFYIQVDGTLETKGSSNRIEFNDGAISFTETSSPWNEQTGSGCIIENAMINCTISTVGSPKISNSFINGDVFAAGGAPILTNNVVTGNMEIYGASIVTRNDFKIRPIFGGKSIISYCNFNEGVTLSGESVSISNSNIICGYEPFTRADASIRFAAINIAKGAVEIFCNNFTLPHNTPSAGAAIWLGTEVNAYIHDNNITDFNSGGSCGIYGAQVGNVSIEKNLIAYNHRGIILGGYESEPSGNILIQNNTIYNNVIGFDGYCTPTFRYNNIFNDYQIYYVIKYVYYGEPIQAPNNYWGTTDEQIISQKISGLVNYNSSLSTCVANAMPDISIEDLPNPAAAANFVYTSQSYIKIIALSGFIVIIITLILWVRRQTNKLSNDEVQHGK